MDEICSRGDHFIAIRARGPAKKGLLLAFPMLSCRRVCRGKKGIEAGEGQLAGRLGGMRCSGDLRGQALARGLIRNEALEMLAEGEQGCRHSVERGLGRDRQDLGAWSGRERSVAYPAR